MSASPGHRRRLPRLAAIGAYCLACWALVAWGVLEAYAYQPPWPWLGVAALELPLSIALAALYALLTVLAPREWIGTTMGFLFLILVVAAPLLNLMLLRRLWRRRKRR